MRLGSFAECLKLGDREQWRFPSSPTTAVIYISFYEDLASEAEPEDLQMLRDVLGQLPEVTVCGEVSGRAAGDSEVAQFVGFLLGEFRGVARDDYTNHCWTLAELQSGAKAHGHTFFDYNGWYKEMKRA